MHKRDTPGTTACEIALLEASAAEAQQSLADTQAALKTLLKGEATNAAALQQATAELDSLQVRLAQFLTGVYVCPVPFFMTSESMSMH